MEFHKKSYELQQDTYKDKETSSTQLENYKNWFDNGTVDLWRHHRMLEVLNPFLEEYKNAKWVTVGDGRYGSSATYIAKRGGDVLATDLDGRLLEQAKNAGMIDKYGVENAEGLSFDSDEFEFSFCKEAYHHFPRPLLGVYEMIRCSSKAIIFTEPNDWLPSPMLRRVLQIAKNKFKGLLGKRVPHPDEGSYEEIGNYVYSISKREFQKVAVALDFPMVAFREFHDHYIPGVEEEKLADNGPLFREIKSVIKKNKIKKIFGLEKPNRIQAVIFKTMPKESLIRKLEDMKFDVIRLPKNPYV